MESHLKWTRPCIARIHPGRNENRSEKRSEKRLYRYGSEGLFVQMRPHIDNKLSSADIDVSCATATHSLPFGVLMF